MTDPARRHLAPFGRSLGLLPRTLRPPPCCLFIYLSYLFIYLSLSPYLTRPRQGPVPAAGAVPSRRPRPGLRLWPAGSSRAAGINRETLPSRCDRAVSSRLCRPSRSSCYFPVLGDHASAAPHGKMDVACVVRG